MYENSYAIRTEFDSKKGFDNVLRRVKSAFLEQGFGVLTEINVAETLKKKMGINYKDKYVILGICNPKFAYDLLKQEKEIGLVLPCNVIVYESGKGKIVVSALNPEIALEIFNKKDKSGKIEDIKCDAREKIVEAIKNLKKGEENGK